MDPLPREITPPVQDYGWPPRVDIETQAQKIERLTAQIFVLQELVREQQREIRRLRGQPA